MLCLGSSPCKNQRRIKKRQVTLPLISAGVVELADSADLGSVTSVVCGFESRRPHHNWTGN